MTGFAPSALLQAARLWERTSAKGSCYMSGRLGGVKLVILENKQHNPDDPLQNHTHSLFFSDGSATQPKPQAANGTTPTLPLPVPQRTYPARRPDDRLKKPAANGKTQLVDDMVPF